MGVINNVKNSEIFTIIVDKIKQFYYQYLISDEKAINRHFRRRLNRDVNLKNPTAYNDKIQWLKLNWYDPLATICADKYRVREFVKEKIGEGYLNELLGVYESVDEIDLDKFPNSFVLKATHGSGYNIICRDKNMMDWDKEFKKMRRWLRTNYYWPKREWVYRDIRPKIICEKFLESENGREFEDYRVLCFDGEPRLIMVDFNINNKEEARRNIYDLKWNLLDEEITYARETSIELEKPKYLNEMLAISEELSKGFPHVRIDFYIIKNKLYFSEMTFFHQSGMGKFSSEEFEEKLGNLIKLPKIN